MLLKEYLTTFTKKGLLALARNFDLKKCSGLQKGKLLDKIVDNLYTEEMMRSRLSCLTKEQIELFRKACVTPQEISINEIMDGMHLSRHLLGYFEELTDEFCVFTDVAEAFCKIDAPAFKEDQQRKGWMVKCILFFVRFHGIAPVEVLYKMYRQKVKCTMDEMIAMLWEMPVDIIESCIFSIEMLGMQDWPKEDPVYLDKGIFVHIPLFEDEELDYLLREQIGKDFYIPSVRQIDEICKLGYEASSQAYKKQESFFVNKLSLPYEQAISWCFGVWVNSYA